MRRQRGKARPLYRYDRYKGARRQRGQTVLTAAAVCAAVGLALVLLRGLGIRFSGFLLLALAPGALVTVVSVQGSGFTPLPPH